MRRAWKTGYWIFVAIFVMLVFAPFAVAAGDSAEQATPIQVNQSYRGTVSGDNRADWWSVNIPSNHIFYVTVRSQSGSGRMRVWLYHAERSTQSLANAYVDSGTTEAVRYPVGPGTYLVRVDQTRGDTDYELTVRAEPPLLPMDPLHNHSAEDAQPMPANGAVTGNLGHYIHDVGTETSDWWYVDVAADALLNLSLRIPDTEGRARMWLYHPERANQSLANVYIDARDSNSISYPVTADRYLIRVDRTSGDFSYELSNVQDRTLLPPDPKNNHSVETALDTTVGQRVTGNLGYYLYPVGTETADWWRLHVPDMGLLHLDLRIPDAQGRARMWLYHEDRTNQSIDNVYVDSASSERISEPVSPGTYYVRIDRTSQFFSYELHPTLDPVLLPASHPVADEREGAVPIALGESVRNSLGHYGQNTSQWWQLRVPAAGTVTVNAWIPDDTGRGRFWIYEGDSTNSLRNMYVDGQEAGSFTVEADPGTYHIRVDRTRGHFSYLLTAVQTTGESRPTFVTMYPTAGSRDVLPTASITAVFDRPLAGASIADTTVYVQDQTGRPVAGTILHEGSMIVFTPARPWESGQSYTLALGSELSDPERVTLGQTVNVDFATAGAPEPAPPTADVTAPAPDMQAFMDAVAALAGFIERAEQAQTMHPNVLAELLAILEQFRQSPPEAAVVDHGPWSTDQLFAELENALRSGRLSDADKQRMIRMLTEQW